MIKKENYSNIEDIYRNIILNGTSIQIINFMYLSQPFRTCWVYDLADFAWQSGEHVLVLEFDVLEKERSLFPIDFKCITNDFSSDLETKNYEYKTIDEFYVSNKKAMKQLINELSSNYDKIFLTCTEKCALSTSKFAALFAEGTIFMIPERRVKVKEVTELKKQLNEAGVSIVGAVFIVES